MVYQRETFHALCRERPEVDLLVMRPLAANIRWLSVLLHETLDMPVDIRVLRRLGDLEWLYGTGTPPTPLPLTQDDLASLAGASRATVNRALRRARIQADIAELAQRAR